MPSNAQPDKRIEHHTRTFNDPRVAGNGRKGPRGEVIVWVDLVSGRAFPMVKQDDDTDTAWELVYSGSDGAAVSVTTAKIAANAVTAAQLAQVVLAAIAGTASLVIAAQASTHRDVTIQLKDLGGTALAAAALARVWISDAAGGAPTATAPDGGFAVQGSGTLIASLTTNKVLDILSTAAGLVVVRLIHAAAGVSVTWFVNVAIGNQLVSSAAVTITNP